jgi:hypothetical protein
MIAVVMRIVIATLIAQQWCVAAATEMAAATVAAIIKITKLFVQ